MMMLLIGDYRMKMNVLDIEIQNIQSLLNYLHLHDKYIELEGKLKTDLELYNKQTLIKKDRNFLSD